MGASDVGYVRIGQGFSWQPTVGVGWSDKSSFSRSGRSWSVEAKIKSRGGGRRWGRGSVGSDHTCRDSKRL